MDLTKKNVLQKCREKIVANIEAKDLIDDLFSKLVIDSEDRDKILSHKERTFRTRCLLDLLLLKGNDEYEIFLDVLSREYNWLANSLRQDIGCISEIEHEEQIYIEALTSGDVPQLPMHYVPRTTELLLIQNKLKALKRGQYLVLHGMTGSGKSVLAISAVRNPDLLKSSFNNCMYFVNAGEAKTQLDIANLLYRLYIKLEIDNKKYADTTVEFNDAGICYMKNQLQRYFSVDFRRDALLILDDVCSESMIQSFNFGCKILITTQDKTLVPQNSELHEINKGFKEQESLLLFSKCTNLKIEQLPIESKTIHELCKGAPLVLALIASNLEKWKHEAQNKERWNYYVNMLIEKKDGRKKEEISNGFLFNTIKHCVESLSTDYQDYYKHFALFVEDVNITPQVLEIVLKKSKYEVEDIVSEFMNKSLIVCAYNAELKSYVYGIHDLLLAHLKQSLKKEDLIGLHRKLVQNYLDVSENDFAKLPNDNYIFTYIGYHLVEARQFHYFPKVYFDLNFIGAKIKSVGIAGLVGDFVRYKEYIINDSTNGIVKLNTFKSFVERYGQDLLKYPDLDIIQCGLQQPVNSEVYETAIKYALNHCSSRLFLQTEFFGSTYYVTYTLDLDDEVCATCFAHFTNTILVGTNSGEIQLWDHNYKSKLRSFIGHTKKIIHIQLSQDTKYFLSVSEDGTVKLWLFEDACISSSGVIVENGFHSHTPHPAIQQSSWVNLFGNNDSINKSKTIQVLNDYIISANFSNDNKYIVIGTKQGLVRAWDYETDEIKFEVKCEGKSIECCTFSLKNSIILLACHNVILIYDFKTNEYISQFMNSNKVTSLFLVSYYETKIIAVSDKCATIWCWTQKDNPNGDICIYDIYKYVLELENRSDAHFICGTVTWDGIYLVLASSDHYITMWNIETKNKVKELVENNGLVVCLDTFLNKESNSNYMYILLSGADNKTVKQWHIEELDHQKNDQKKLLPEFSTSWINGNIPLISAISSTSQVQIFRGRALIVESDVLKQPKILVFSPCGNYVAIGVKDGVIIIFDYKNKIYNYIMNLDGPINYMEYLNDSESRSGYVLFAGAENTCLMSYKNNQSKKLKAAESKENVSKGVFFKTIKCFSLFEVKRIISIEENGNIKLWCNNGIEDILIVNDSTSAVTMATISQKQNMIALTFTNTKFIIYELLYTFDKITCLYDQGKLLDSIPRSCCFSTDGHLLAIGQDSGSIVIWSVENKVQLSVLELHKSTVRNMIFSPQSIPGAPLVLVSVGDQVAWWDITHVCLKATENMRRNSRSRRSMHLSNPSNLFTNTTTTDVIHDSWVKKQGRENKLELLSAIKLAGVHALNISVSPNFTCFVTIDSNGLLYIMNVLQSPNI